jgi:hypothetical protein
VWVSYSDGTLQNINIANATEERFFGGIPMESSGDMALAADGSNIITYLNQRDAAGDTATIYSINLDDGAATAVYGGRHVLRGVGASARTGNIYAADTAAMFIVRDGAKGAAHSTGLRPRQFLFFVQNTKLD